MKKSFVALLVLLLGSTPLWSHTANLTWKPSPTTGVTATNVYRGSTASGPFTKVGTVATPVTKYADTTVVDGTTVYYAVTAVAGTLESSYSNVVQAAIPGSVTGVAIAPTTGSVQQGSTLQFTPTVSCSVAGCNQAVTWTTTGSTVSQTGLLTATGAVGGITVKAISQADSTKVGSAIIQVTAGVALPTVSMTCSAGASGTTFTCTINVTNAVSVVFTYNGTQTTWAGFTAPLQNQFTIRWPLPGLPKGLNTFTAVVTNSAGKTATVTVTATI